jgi:pyruvate/2-oxoglutarate dehydrogenase complex dihydrolipoamide dehydrogenase (E3) component
VLPNGKFRANADESLNKPHVFAVGDVLDGRLELTPVAIEAGRRVVRRLFGGSNKLMNYDTIPTTVFTPLEYGCCGLSEEEAIKRHGDANIEIYHTIFSPLEW